MRYRTQSGTAVLRDFVEFPSQIFEHWMSAPETLRAYARHYRTGEPIPEDLLHRLNAARNFNQGFATVEYTALGADRPRSAPRTTPRLSTSPLRARVPRTDGGPEEIGLRHRLPHFQHLFAGGGYAAGYYAYLWAEVLEADGFAAFTEKGDSSIPSWRRGSRRSTAPATRVTRWSSIVLSAAASRRLPLCWSSAGWPRPADD